MNTPFIEFPKMARLSREVIITEKIDGTNASVCIVSGSMVTHPEAVAHRFDSVTQTDLVMLAGSRTRWITPADDNFGFARWVADNAEALWALGEGAHFGEWWGSGIQRGYGLPKGEKRFSLFNVSRWVLAGQTPGVRSKAWDNATKTWKETMQDVLPACCGLVPVLYRGDFTQAAWENSLTALTTVGSVAAPGFMKPEGIVVFHTAAMVGFKKTIEKDDKPKGAS
jgi:hypothetical protein